MNNEQGVMTHPGDRFPLGLRFACTCDRLLLTHCITSQSQKLYLRYDSSLCYTVNVYPRQMNMVRIHCANRNDLFCLRVNCSTSVRTDLYNCHRSGTGHHRGKVVRSVSEHCVARLVHLPSPDKRHIASNSLFHDILYFSKRPCFTGSRIFVGLTPVRRASLQDLSPVLVYRSEWEYSQTSRVCCIPSPCRMQVYPLRQLGSAQQACLVESTRPRSRR